MRSFPWLSLLSLLFVVAGCSHESSNTPTKVLITIDSDMRDEIASIAVQVLDVNAETIGSSHVFDLNGGATWPVSFAVTPASGKDGGSFLVTVRGLDSSGATLADTKGLLTFVPGKSTTASLWLLSVCKGVVCGDDQTCVGQGSQAGTCDDVPALDMQSSNGTPPSNSDGSPPVLMAPDDSSGDAGSQGDATSPVTRDASVQSSDAVTDAATTEPVGSDAQVSAHAVEPTFAGFSTLGAPRLLPSGHLLLDDGFEFGERACNAAGYCVTSSLVP